MRAAAVVTSVVPLFLAGCAAAGPSTVCTPISTFGVAASTNKADHNAAPPGNQVKFSATVTPGQTGGFGCEIPAVIAVVNATWTTSDPLDTTVSSAPGDTNGLAACTGATSTPATLTATYGTGSSTQTATATLSCS